MHVIMYRHGIKLLLIMTVITELSCFSVSQNNNNNNDILSECKNCTQNREPELQPKISINSNNNSLEVKDTNVARIIDEGRKKKEEKGLMERILPMMVIPFMISTAMIPMMLVSLKVMLLKSMFVGKIAVLLMIINMFRSRSDGDGGVFNHDINSRDMPVSMYHYGYRGDEEYGAYINKRRKRYFNEGY